MGWLTQAPWPSLAMGSQVLVVQTMPSLQEAVLFGCVQAPAPLQASSVQTLPSLVQAVPAPVWQLWADSLQVLLHSGPLAHGSPLCVHVPPLHVSVPLQKSPSSQEAVFGVCAQVPAPLQASSVQTLSSLVQAVPAAVWQAAAASLQGASRAGPPAQGAARCVQMPAPEGAGPWQKPPALPEAVCGV